MLSAHRLTLGGAQPSGGTGKGHKGLSPSLPRTQALFREGAGMGSMGWPLSPGTCLLLCLLTQLAAAASGDRGHVGQGGLEPLVGGPGAGATTLGVSGDPVTSPWVTSKGKPTWPPHGGLRPQSLKGFVSAPTKAGPVPSPPSPTAPSPPAVALDQVVR